MLKHIVFVSVLSVVEVKCRAAIGLEAMSPYLLTAEKSNCKFSTHLCKPSSLSLVKTVINITSITGCQNMCAKEKSPKCKFVTLTNFRNITSCHLLTNCDDKVLTLCLSSTSNQYYRVLQNNWQTLAAYNWDTIWSFLSIFGLFWLSNMGDFSLWYSLGIGMKKKLKNFALKKG